MADPSIVSCPGCGKRYSVPPGAAPGQFQCQDCSAVVVYGRGGAAAPPAGPSGKGPAGKGSAKSHAKAAAAKRTTARKRRDDAEDEDDRPARGPAGRGEPKRVPAMAIAAGAGVLVVLIAVVVLATRKGKETPKPVTNTAAATAPASGMGTFTAENAPPGETAPAPAPAPAPRPAPAPAPAHKPAPPPAPESGAAPEEPKPTGGFKTAVRGGITDKSDVFTPAANPPSGSLYGKSQAAILVMLREKRSDVWVDPGHLPDTPADLAQKIDADIAKMGDPNGGSEFLRSQDRLIKIGRPALPKVVGLLSKLDFSKYTTMVEARDACALGDAIDNVMRSITGFDKIPQLQYSPMDGKIAQYTQSLDDWAVWWFTIGYKRETFYKKAGAAEDEKL